VGQIARSGVVSGVIITGAIAAIIYLLGDATLHIFLPPDSEALPVARHINDTVLWSFVLFTVTFALSGVVRATGTVWPPLVILIISMFAIRIPFAWLLTPRFGADAIWWSFPLGTITASVLTSLYYKLGHWKGTQLVEQLDTSSHTADTGMATPAVSEHGQLSGPETSRSPFATARGTA
jgi:Na+-driven multidrug efflux pump